MCPSLTLQALKYQGISRANTPVRPSLAILERDAEFGQTLTDLIAEGEILRLACLGAQVDQHPVGVVLAALAKGHDIGGGPHSGLDHQPAGITVGVQIAQQATP